MDKNERKVAEILDEKPLELYILKSAFFYRFFTLLG